MGDAPAHDHHQTEAKKKECKSRDGILDADHFVIGRKHPLLPEAGVVVRVVVVAVGVFFVVCGVGHKILYILNQFAPVFWRTKRLLCFSSGCFGGKCLQFGFRPLGFAFCKFFAHFSDKLRRDGFFDIIAETGAHVV